MKPDEKPPRKFRRPNDTNHEADLPWNASLEEVNAYFDALKEDWPELKLSIEIYRRRAIGKRFGTTHVFERLGVLK